MIHIDLEVNLKCDNDPSHPGKYFYQMTCPQVSLGSFTFINFIFSHHFSSECPQIRMENIQKFWSNATESPGRGGGGGGGMVTLGID